MHWKELEKCLGLYVTLTIPRHDYCGKITYVSRKKILLKPGVIVARTTLEQMAMHPEGLLGAIFEQTYNQNAGEVGIIPQPIRTYSTASAPSPSALGRIIRNYSSPDELQWIKPYTTSLSLEDQTNVVSAWYDATSPQIKGLAKLISVLQISPPNVVSLVNKMNLTPEQITEFSHDYIKTLLFQRKQITEFYISAVQSNLLTYSQGLAEMRRLAKPEDGMSLHYVNQPDVTKFTRQCKPA
ncbi:MAG: hypothetical protein WC254_07785 [Candidatus Woesearchaeota archaeon]|jgi:hypothetical protein